MGKRVIVVGGGIAGMQTALKLSAGGVSALLLECDADLGGKLTGWPNCAVGSPPATSRCARGARSRKWRATA